LLKFHAIKKYGSKLRPKLVNRFGEKKYYSPSEVRSTVYQKNFNPKYLPLAYLLCLEKNDLKNVLFTEYPELDIEQYRIEINDYITRKKYGEYFQRLNHELTNN
jgi:hypothetical protein|tara:strand:+ start:32228 stop:32539 length:312 start_codon:yes stop_codon:yes gene_type:complete